MNKILIVEDDDDSRILLKRLLETTGYEVSDAVNGVDALEQAKRSRPDMILSDIMMPEMDGFMLCRLAKADETLKTEQES